LNLRVHVLQAHEGLTEEGNDVIGNGPFTVSQCHASLSTNRLVTFDCSAIHMTEFLRDEIGPWSLELTCQEAL